MNKSFYFSLILLCFFVGGCTTVPLVEPHAAVKAASLMSKIRTGMTREEVLSVMDKPVTIGYEIDQATGKSRPIQTKSFYSTEMMTLGGVVYQLDQFIMRAESTEGEVAEENLLPLVFQDNIMVAKGHEELKVLREKYGSR